MSVFERAKFSHRDRFRAAQLNLPQISLASHRSRVPKLSDPEIKELMKKYPNLAKQEENRNHKLGELRDVIHKIEHYLDFESAEYDINLHELQKLLDKEQFEMHRKAADLLAGASEIENRNLKTHLNYTLDTMRDTKEMEREVIHEY